MKSTKFVLMLATAGFLFGLNSCKKYEDGGPMRKAEKNLVGNWSLQTYYLNGTDMTSSLVISNYKETYNESGAYTRSYTDSNGDFQTADGTWALEDDNAVMKISGLESFELSAEYSTVSASEYTLLKLTEDDLWYEFVNGGATHEFHLVH